MKPIKYLTLDSVNLLSKEISSFVSLNSFEISKKIADYLMIEGNANFIELYNNFATTNNKQELLIKLGINDGNNPSSSN